jgi:hypothetical protein
MTEVGHLGRTAWTPRRIALGVWRRINPKSTAGLTWKRQGESSAASSSGAGSAG